MSNRNTQPTKILADASRFNEVPREVVPQLLVLFAKLQRALATRMMSVASYENGTKRPAATESDEWLTTDQAAVLMKVNKKWLYRHKKELPFCRRLSRRKLLFSKAGILRWIETRKVR